MEGENFGERVHIKNWQIIFWQMPKIVKAPKITMCQHFTGQFKNHRVLLWHVVQMKHFIVHK